MNIFKLENLFLVHTWNCFLYINLYHFLHSLNTSKNQDLSPLLPPLLSSHVFICIIMIPLSVFSSLNSPCSFCLTCQMLQALHSFCGPLQDIVQYTNIYFCTREPRLRYRTLDVDSLMKNNHLQILGNVLPNAAQEVVLFCNRELLTYI